MKKKKKDSRRQFLKNTSLSVLSVAAFPTILQSTSSSVPSSIKKYTSLCDQSTEDAYGQGPFYTANAPLIQNNQLADINEIGTRIIISGQVYNIECSEVIPNTEIDIWHANDLGGYDNTGYNLRGKTTTNSQGFYVFESIKPGLYLNGSIFRPSHIHFKITPPGFNTLITQLYFQGDPYIPTDAAASITSGSFDATNRIIPLVSNSNGELEGTWDIIIDGDGVPVGTNNIHLDKGIIYSATPNPFTNRIEINYGVFQKAKVGISVYNIRGQTVAILDEKILDPEKYYVSWEPHKNLPNGHYFISIKINDLQVHYIKVIRQ
ncbi:T9SS type A sorting domain-containing protein [Flavobacteriales bacterium]|nr:T9SS type A sorting domain-containing protein [Flavobacteriales bacterium]